MTQEERKALAEDECPGCGSSPLDREARRRKYPDENIPTGLSTCPHCGSLKCCMCDMGDDVECVSCGGGGDD